MRTAALEKFDTANPARYGVPDSELPVSPARVPAVFSNIAFVENGNTGRTRQRALACCAAAILEFLLLAVIWSVERQPARQPDVDTAAIEMVQAPQEPLPRPPVPQKIELPTLKPVPIRSIPRMRMAMDRPTTVPAPQMAAPVTQTPPSPPPPASASAEAIDRFDAQVRAAIQAAIIYPPTARMMKQQGRTKVAFRLVQGHAENPHILQSSGIPAIDAAAIAAVRDAAYPAPAAELTSKALEFAVFVEFNLSIR